MIEDCPELLANKPGADWAEVSGPIRDLSRNEPIICSPA
jgi:hypothetical protein